LEHESAVRLDNYMFDLINQTGTKLASRAGAVVGVKGQTDAYMIYVLGGEHGDASLLPNSLLDVNAKTMTALNVNFSRSGACYSQDGTGDASTAVWIIGGMATGSQNTEPFTKFKLADNSFTPMPTPPFLKLDEVSCAVTPDASKFYVLPFDQTTEFEEEGATCTSLLLPMFDGKNWSNITTGSAGPAKAGSSAFYFNNSIVVFGGRCGTDYSGDVYRLSFTNNPTLLWTKDPSTGPAASNVAAFIQGNILFVYGGVTSAGVSDEAFAYDLSNFTWTPINSSNPGGRSFSSVAPMVNRAFIIGGRNEENTYLDDIVQLVLMKPCLGTGCEDCTNVDGCGWCSASSLCLAGGQFSPFMASACNSTDNYINDLDSCPQVFPSYGIALLVIGGVVVVGIIIFAIMKVRSGDEKEGYERIS